jgi:TolB-like protein
VQLFKELQRRNVFRVTFGYVISSWLLAQVADLVLETIEAPDWVMKAILLVLALGFPVVVFFSWVYEVTPDGVKHQSEIDRDQSITYVTSRKLDRAITAVLVIALAYFAYDKFVLDPSRDEALVEATAQAVKEQEPDELKVAANAEKSIAVLPFVNMSSDPEQEYFSDGISEELLNGLAKIDSLKVAARTSSFSFKGQNKPIGEIAQVLGVAHILEGSVRKSGSQIRITAQLIRVSDGFHMWSETYDRELTDIFKIQDEISAAIVGSLKETLGIELVTKPVSTKTINPEAYDLYLQGLKGLNIYTFESLATAVTAFESAIEIEPDFLMAKIKLAETYQWQIQTGSTFDRTILDSAEAILADVLAIAPDSAEANYVRSLVATKKGERDLATQYIKEAYRLNPNEADLIAEYAQLLGFEIGEEKTKSLFNRAIQLDPLNAYILIKYANYFTNTLQQYEQAGIIYKQVFKVNSEGLYPWALEGHYRRVGNIQGAIHQNEKSLAADPLDPEGPLYMSYYYLCLGDGAKALHYAKKTLLLNSILGDASKAKVDALIHLGEEENAITLINNTLDNPDTIYRRIIKSDLVSSGIYLFLKSNDLNKAEELLTRHFPEVASLIDAPAPKTTVEVGDPALIKLFSIVYWAQGKTEKAQRLADRLKLLDEDFYSSRQSRLRLFEYQQLASISAVQHHDEKAIEYLELLPTDSFPAWWRRNILHSPYFLHLQQYPRYMILIERFEAEMARLLVVLSEEQSAEKPIGE